MEILGLLFVVFLIGWGIYLIRYTRHLRAAVDYSNKHSANIFGARYRSVYHLMGDAHFMNSLWRWDQVQACSDENLRGILAEGHRMLRVQIFSGIAMFIALMVFGIVRAAA